MTSRGQVVTLGEALGVLRADQIGSLAQVNSLAVGTGGAEANVAIGLARLGARATWIGRVGEDGLGRRVLRELRAEGVAVRAQVETEATTGLLLKENPALGRTRVTYYRNASAGSRLSPADLEGLTLSPHDIVHVTGITPALSSSAAAAVTSAIGLAREAGATVSYDVNHRSTLWSDADAVSVHRQLISQADVVFAGDDEAQLVLGRRDMGPHEMAGEIAALGPQEVVIKQGERGALALIDDQAVVQKAVHLDHVVDTVGAGDAFVAGYLAESLAGLSVSRRLDTAVATGAAACLHPGDWEGAVTRADLLTETDPVQR